MSDTSMKYPLRAIIARATQTGDAARATEARRELAAIKLAEYIERVVATAPPLTDAQRVHLFGLLNGPTA